MSLARSSEPAGRRRLLAARERGCQGFSYLEVLLATLLISVSLIPALEALQSGLASGEQHALRAVQRHRLVAKMEEVLVRSFSELAQEAIRAGGGPASYSDEAGAEERRLVFLSSYDGDNADADDDPFTDPDDGLLWVRVEIEGTSEAFTTLTSP